MPDFDVFSFLEIRKPKPRSHGIRKKRNDNQKKRARKRSNTSLKDLSKILEDHGRHSMLSFSSSLPISVLRILDTGANKFYDRNHQLYDAALLTRCYTHYFNTDRSKAVLLLWFLTVTCSCCPYLYFFGSAIM